VVKLEVHHRTYTRLGFEIPEDITVLCDDCHKAVTNVLRRVLPVPRYSTHAERDDLTLG
jgi:hypothetical protein